MPELRCPECGKELLPAKPGDRADCCVCSACGREVFARLEKKVKVKCAQCGQENETTVRM